MGIPAIRPTSGPQMPAQIRTLSVAIGPPEVRTARTRPRPTSNPSTLTPPWNSAPLADASRATASATFTASAPQPTMPATSTPPLAASRTSQRLLADGDEGLQVLVHGRVDTGVLVLGQHLLPLPGGDLVGGHTAASLPAVIVVGRGDQRPVE